MDFTIEAGHDISGATLSAALVTNNITIHTATGTNTANDKYGTVGTNGDIFVNEPVSWTAIPGTSPTTLTLIAYRDVVVKLGAPITAVDGNLVVCCGRDIRINDAISTTRGSILLGAGRDLYSSAAITTTNGNITMCAAHDVNISAAITLTNGTSDPNRSLGLERGLVLSAGTGGTGPGVVGGTVILTGPPNSITVTGADATDAPVNIYYNPTSYTTPTDFLGSGKFALAIPGTLHQHMLVFANAADKEFDGTTTAFLSSSLKGNPAGVSLVQGPGSSANFDSPWEGADKIVTFSGYTLTGVNAASFALPVSCCGPVVAKTTGTILPAPPPAAAARRRRPPAAAAAAARRRRRRRWWCRPSWCRRRRGAAGRGASAAGGGAAGRGAAGRSATGCRATRRGTAGGGRAPDRCAAGSGRATDRAARRAAAGDGAGCAAVGLGPAGACHIAVGCNANGGVGRADPHRAGGGAARHTGGGRTEGAGGDAASRAAAGEVRATRARSQALPQLTAALAAPIVFR